MRTRRRTRRTSSPARAITGVLAGHHAAEPADQPYVAQQNGQDATGLGNAGRFFMPNTILWDDHAPARNYAFAPADRVALLRDVYQVVAGTSRAAAEAIDDLALAAGAPTRILAFARQALPAQRNGPDTPDLAALKSRLAYFTRPRHIRIPDAAPAHPISDTPDPDHPLQHVAEQEPPAKLTRGPVEETIRAASVTDPGLLIQAAALDRAAKELVNRAVRLAAQDTPDASVPARKSRPEERRDRRPSSERRNRGRRAR